MRPYQSPDSNANTQAAAEVYARLGAVHRQQGRVAAAVASYRHAVRLQPTAAELHYHLGNVLYAQGDKIAAMDSYREALSLAPDLAEAHTNLGVALHTQGDLDGARARLETALQLHPDLVEAHTNLGVVLHKQGELDAARTHLETALYLHPDLAEAHTNLGVVLHKQGELDAARTHLETALHLRPAYAEALTNLGTVLRAQGHLEAAIATHQAALRLEPRCAAIHYNLGAVWRELGQYAAAAAAYDTALRLQPDYAEAQWNRALVWLTQGNLAAGWSAYEWRWQTVQGPRPFPLPYWDGTSLAHRTVLVTAEQGLGDEMLFASCVPDLLAQAGHVVLECDPRLAPLFTRAFARATVQGAPRHDTAWLAHVAPDVYLPAGSLPRYLRPTLSSFPRQPGYLVPDPQRRVQYQQRLAALGPGRKIGIAWRSLQRRGTSLHYTSLKQWEPLLRVPGIHWINLQYDHPEAELAAVSEQWQVPIHTWDDLDLFADLDGVAALMAGLDLVIAPDTTVAALAACLGRTVWRLTVPWGAWDMLGTEYCPWFPSMRVVPQSQRGQWHDVFVHLAQVLRPGAAHGNYPRQYGGRN